MRGLAVLLVSVLVASTLLAAPAQSGADARKPTVDPALQMAFHEDPLGLHPVIVTAREGHDPLAILRPLGLDATPVPVLPIAGALLDADQLRALAKDARVRSLWLDKPIRWDLDQSVHLVGAPEVWETFGATGRGVTVAVFDTGIDSQHPDLSSRVVASVRPYGLQQGGDARLLETGRTTQVGFVGSTDLGMHGTHVAGIIAGTGAASDRTYRGVAPSARLIALGALDTAGGPVPVASFHAIASYGWILENREARGIRVVANSWGIDQGGYPSPDDPVNVATHALYEAGLIVIFSAGNDGPNPNTLGTIKAVPWTIATAAGTKDRGLIAFSSRGIEGDPLLHPDVTAPGYLIYSARAIHQPGTSTGAVLSTLVTNPRNPLYTPFYIMISGTSMASPHVSGAVALMLDVNPSLSPDQALDILRATTDPMVNQTTGLPMPEWEVGTGHLNATKAYLRAKDVEGALSAFENGTRAHGMAELLSLLPVVDGAPLAKIEEAGITAGEHKIVVPPGARALAVTLDRASDAASFAVVVRGPDGRVAFDFGVFTPGSATHLSPVFLEGEYTIRVSGERDAAYDLRAEAVNMMTVSPIDTAAVPEPARVPAPALSVLVLALAAVAVALRRRP